MMLNRKTIDKLSVIICIGSVTVGTHLGCASSEEEEEEQHHQATTTTEPQSHKNHNEHEIHEEHKGHQHSPPGNSFDRNALARIMEQQCEHEVPILDCDECRYEVGAVEVAPSLMDPSGDDLIRTAKLEPRSRDRNLRLPGEVAFDERKVAHVSPRVGGVVRQAYVTLGDQVKAGAKLILMDSLELGQLRSRYLQSLAKQDLAQKNFEREKNLHERKIASGRDKLQAETALREAKIELQSSAEQLRLLGLSGRSLDSGGTQRGGVSALTAPVNGTVVAMHAVSGERISPTESIVTIADLSKVWVWANAYERDLGPLLAASKGTKLRAIVKVAAFPEKHFVGDVDYVGAIMEETTRTVKVRIVVDNDQKLLRPGMFATVSIELSGNNTALIAPADAVMLHEDRQFVFVKVGPYRFLRRDVTARSVGDDLVALVDGIDAGEEIVVQGAFLLKSDILREQMGAGCAH